MENENFIEKIAKGFSQNASVKYVYGDPIQTGNKTIIPVASIAYGFGGGFGQAPKGKKADNSSNIGTEPLSAGEGAGGGGGLRTTLKGIYEITPESTRFIPANNTKSLLTGIVIGFLLKAMFFSK
ncbi:GerW family sporulation protein [Flavisolibacter tropicus]|uniref:Sporulation protein n=1 Tax=Flavisolibacter tropicus TaxID=1492898 RepID=A0A172TUF0_9BACT|nr:spore germination protein GerW family protein [Flavisolibacter tropicus]ANE50741.1 hypothetical protein SY85_09765 [Flavisolibacter tropicus]